MLQKKILSKEKLILLLEGKYKVINSFISKSIYKDLIIESIEKLECTSGERWDELVVESAQLAALEANDKSFDEAYGIIHKRAMEYNYNEITGDLV